MNRTYECVCHPEKEPIPAWNYLGGIDYVCPECRTQATLVKRKPEHCKYYQHGETGRTCATLHTLKGDWYEISKEAYFEIEKQSTATRPTPLALDAASAAPAEHNQNSDIVPAGEVDSQPRQ